jgi:hypothetical protein
MSSGDSNGADGSNGADSGDGSGGSHDRDVHRMVTNPGPAREDDEAAMDPLDATQPTVAMETVGAEPCPHCGATLALDQRYCLQCGAPRTYLGGMLLERLRAPAGSGPPGQPLQAGPAKGAGPPNGMAPPHSTAPHSTAPFGAPASAGPWQRGGALTLIAGIGVLLLAMGVGVLIGRSGGFSGASSGPPQVISVGGAPSIGAASTPTTATPSPAETPAAKAGAGSSAAKHKAKEAAGSSGVGSTPSKPAPATVLKSLRTGGSGQSYEQKSKNLPNVVETG